MDTSSSYFRIKWSLHIALLAEIYDQNSDIQIKQESYGLYNFSVNSSNTYLSIFLAEICSIS